MLEKLKSGAARKEICNQFNCSPATLTRLVKNKDIITKIAQQNKNISKKRMRLGSNKEVEDALLIWFREMRSKEAILTGPLLLEKANYFAKKLNVDFVPKQGWLERWKKRENIHFKNVHGEKSSADLEAANDWIKYVLPDHLKEYPAEAIYNADESALFYKALPSGTLTNRSDIPSGKKLPKDRVTLLFVVNATGSDKHVYCIGRSLNPRCFKNINKLPVNYRANSKAWMTSTMWTDIMQELDSKFKAIHKKVLLFVDNAACHKICDDTVLQNIKVVFLPANTTSLIQPLDQGVIRSFKCHYRKNIVSKQLLHLECGLSLKEFSKKIDVLEALQMIKSAWFNVTPETICNCFRKAGIIPGDGVDITEEVELMLSDALGEEIEHFLNIDNNIECFGEQTDDDIIDQVTNNNKADEGKESENEIDISLPKPSMKQAFEAMTILKAYLGDHSEALNNLYDLENIMCQTHFKKTNQMKIKDFFKSNV